MLRALKDFTAQHPPCSYLVCLDNYVLLVPGNPFCVPRGAIVIRVFLFLAEMANTVPKDLVRREFAQPGFSVVLPTTIH